MREHELAKHAALVVRHIAGQDITLDTNPVYLGILPTNQTFGGRPEGVILRPEGNARFAIDAVPNTAGLESAYLASGVEYVIPLHPKANTLGFLSDASETDKPMRVRWIFASHFTRPGV